VAPHRGSRRSSPWLAEAVEKYGAEAAAWLMDQQYMHYKRLVFVAHTQEDLDAYRPRALEVAEYCKRWGMQYEEVSGSEAYIRDLVTAVATVSESDDQFLVIPPGGSIRQDQFLRMHVIDPHCSAPMVWICRRISSQDSISLSLRYGFGSVRLLPMPASFTPRPKASAISWVAWKMGSSGSMLAAPWRASRFR